MKRLVLLFFLIAAPAAAQTCPPFPVRGAQIIDALVPRYPGGTLAGTDDQRRELTRAILEQLVYEFPADGWTWKSADPGRPPSKDALARTVNGRLCNYDWQSGSSRQRQVQPGQLGDDITGQNPIPVAGVNHLSDQPPAPPPGPIQPPPVVTDLSGVYNRLDALSAALGVPIGDSLHAQAERIFSEAQAVAAEQRAAHAVIEDKVDNPGWFKQVFGNRYFQMILAGAGTWVAQRATK